VYHNGELFDRWIHEEFPPSFHAEEVQMDHSSFQKTDKRLQSEHSSQQEFFSKNSSARILQQEFLQAVHHVFLVRASQREKRIME
jgi:hypothetical protein